MRALILLRWRPLFGPVKRTLSSTRGLMMVLVGVARDKVQHTGENFLRWDPVLAMMDAAR